MCNLKNHNWVSGSGKSVSFEDITNIVKDCIEGGSKVFIGSDSFTRMPFNLKNATSKFSDMLKGYVAGAGFECRIKPDAWASQSIADRHSK
jgi:predicted RNase H-related nuclease YkuK (DUF458 family)